MYLFCLWCRGQYRSPAHPTKFVSRLNGGPALSAVCGTVLFRHVSLPFPNHNEQEASAFHVYTRQICPHSPILLSALHLLARAPVRVLGERRCALLLVAGSPDRHGFPDGSRRATRIRPAHPSRRGRCHPPPPGALRRGVGTFSSTFSNSWCQQSSALPSSIPPYKPRPWGQTNALRPRAPSYSLSP